MHAHYSFASCSAADQVVFTKMWMIFVIFGLTFDSSVQLDVCPFAPAYFSGQVHADSILQTTFRLIDENNLLNIGQVVFILYSKNMPNIWTNNMGATDHILNSQAVWHGSTEN